jgi:hypothetical protein
VLVGLCLGRLGGAVACPYIYTRALGGVAGWGWGTDGDGRQERQHAPPRPPTHQHQAARTYVSAVGESELEEARPRAGREEGKFACAGTGPDHLSRLVGICIYARAWLSEKFRYPFVREEWHIGTSDLSEQMGSSLWRRVRACARTHGHWPAPAVTAQWSMQINSTAARVVRGRTAPTLL